MRDGYRVVCNCGDETERRRFSCYACDSLLKRISGICETRRRKARQFETRILDHLREHVLTESHSTELVTLLGEEMDYAEPGIR